MKTDLPSLATQQSTTCLPRNGIASDPIFDECKSKNESAALAIKTATYPLSDAAALLGVSKWTLQRAIKRNEIPHIAVGARKFIPKWWLDSKLEPPASSPLHASSGRASCSTSASTRP